MISGLVTRAYASGATNANTAPLLDPYSSSFSNRLLHDTAGLVVPYRSCTRLDGLVPTFP